MAPTSNPSGKTLRKGAWCRNSGVADLEAVIVLSMRAATCFVVRVAI
jgi:hypothetical protein